MDVETKSNGTLQIKLTPRSAIEKAYTETMLELASKGVAVRLLAADDKDNSIVVEMNQ